MYQIRQVCRRYLLHSLVMCSKILGTVMTNPFYGKQKVQVEKRPYANSYVCKQALMLQASVLFLLFPDPFPTPPKPNPENHTAFTSSAPATAVPFPSPSLTTSSPDPSGFEVSYPTLLTIPNPFVRPSLNSNLSPGAKYSGLCTNRKATVARSPVRMKDLSMSIMAQVWETGPTWSMAWYFVLMVVAWERMSTFVCC